MIFLSLLIEINHLNFFHASSFTFEGHDRASLSIDKVNLPRKTPPFFIRFTLSSLFLFFFFSNSIPFPSISLTFRNFFHVKILLRRRHWRVEKIIGEKKKRENYPSGSSVSARDIWKLFGRSQRDKFEVRRLAWWTWHGWIRSNCVTRVLAPRYN